MTTETRHKYDYRVDSSSDTAPACVVRMVGRGKKVLEIGAGPGSITRILKNEQECAVTGIEIDSDAIPHLAPFCERVIQGDLNSDRWSEPLDQQKFDVVVAADVLEHVARPLAVLIRMAGCLDDSGYVVVSLPHIGHSAIHACLLSENFDYREWGLLDRTHIRFFGIHNIEALFCDAGLAIVDVAYVLRKPEDTEFAECWRRLSPAVREMIVRENPFGQVYQVVVKAVPLGRSTATMVLSNTVPAPLPEDRPLNVLCSQSMAVAWVKRLTPAKLHPCLKSVARRLGLLS